MLALMPTTYSSGSQDTFTAGVCTLVASHAGLRTQEQRAKKEHRSKGTSKGRYLNTTYLPRTEYIEGVRLVSGKSFLLARVCVNSYDDDRPGDIKAFSSIRKERMLPVALKVPTFLLPREG